MKRRVLLVARELDLGGSERQLAEIAMGLDRDRFEPHIAAFRARGLRWEQLQRTGLPLVHFPVGSFRSRGALLGAWQMASYIRRHRIALVHAFDAPLTVFSTPVVRYATPAIILSSQRGDRRLTPEYHKLLRWTDRRVDGIVVNCRYLMKHLVEEERVPERLIHLCYNGIDLDEFRPADSPRTASSRPPDLPEGFFVIGVICALRPEKGIDTLLEAAARLRPFSTPVKLVIAGSGSLLEALQTRARELGVFSDCIWQPATSEVPRWLRHFDVFVLPSLNEAFSNSLMEAMACRRPVIASNVGGNPELVEHGARGLLFERGNAEHLADALRSLMDDPQRRSRLAEAGYRFIHDNFSRQTAARRMGEIYDSFIERRR
jgi:glycosyltransferase involved in cell wall biosynthesis